MLSKNNFSIFSLQFSLCTRTMSHTQCSLFFMCLECFINFHLRFDGLICVIIFHMLEVFRLLIFERIKKKNVCTRFPWHFWNCCKFFSCVNSMAIFCSTFQSSVLEYANSFHFHCLNIIHIILIKKFFLCRFAIVSTTCISNL